MQGAHRRHEADHGALSTLRVYGGAQIADPRQRVHRVSRCDQKL